MNAIPNVSPMKRAPRTGACQRKLRSAVGSLRLALLLLALAVMPIPLYAGEAPPSPEPLPDAPAAATSSSTAAAPAGTSASADTDTKTANDTPDQSGPKAFVASEQIRVDNAVPFPVDI